MTSQPFIFIFTFRYIKKDYPCGISVAKLRTLEGSPFMSSRTLEHTKDFNSPPRFNFLRILYLKYLLLTVLIRFPSLYPP